MPQPATIPHLPRTSDPTQVAPVQALARHRRAADAKIRPSMKLATLHIRLASTAHRLIYDLAMMMVALGLHATGPLQMHNTGRTLLACHLCLKRKGDATCPGRQTFNTPKLLGRRLDHLLQRSNRPTWLSNGRQGPTADLGQALRRVAAVVMMAMKVSALRSCPRPTAMGTRSIGARLQAVVMDEKSSGVKGGNRALCTARGGFWTF